MEMENSEIGSASMAMSFGTDSKLRFLYRWLAVLMGVASAVAALPVAVLSFGCAGVALLLGKVRPLRDAYESLSQAYDRIIQRLGKEVLQDQRDAPAQERKFIEPIDRGMFIELETMDDCESHLVASGLQIIHRQDLTRQCAKSWDLALDVIRDKSFWKLAAKMGKDFVANLRAFRAMRAGYSSGNFVYGLFTARRPFDPAAK